MVLGGATIIDLLKRIDDFDYPFEFIVRSGRAVVISALSGTLETNQPPLFRALGTKEPDKRHRLYDGGHRNLVTRPDLIGEVLDWFDRWLGPTLTH